MIQKDLKASWVAFLTVGVTFKQLTGKEGYPTHQSIKHMRQGRGKRKS